MLSYEALTAAFENLPLPAAFVDLDALDANARAMAQRAKGTPLRIASKSVRCVAVLQHVLQSHSGYQGLMTYTARETLWLAQQGFDDLLLAYPLARANEAAALAQAAALGRRVWAMADLPQHLPLLQQAAQDAGITLKVCLDLDMSMPVPGIWFGVRRSSIRTPQQAVAFAREVARYPNLQLDALMGYEAQVAGLGDRMPGGGLKNRVVAYLKARSVRELASRRAAVVDALQTAGFPLTVVNGGGTGSVETTRAEACITEVTVGSGLYQSHLFDYYSNFRHTPAAGYLTPITRNPAPGVFTAAGGGYPASGTPGWEKSPAIWMPQGARLLPNEGVGEVQTPFSYKGPLRLQLGMPLVLRHAKAGELMERFQTVYLMRAGQVVDQVPTYRGQGQHFL
jgi:D-serine deaminase-like pyridoxal phosphate-dependent protein